MAKVVTSLPAAASFYVFLDHLKRVAYYDARKFCYCVFFTYRNHIARRGKVRALLHIEEHRSSSK